MKLGINGRFYAARVTGVQRFGREVAVRLMADATLFLPANAEPPAGLPSTTRVSRGRLAGHLWEQFELPWQIRHAGCDVVLHLAGTAPIVGISNGVLVIHDILPLTHARWFGRPFRLWRRAVLRTTAPRAACVVTVSRWARDEISRTLAMRREDILVAPQGLAPFDHPAAADEVTRMREKRLLFGPYLLAVGADPRKNLQFLGLVLRRWKERGNRPPPLVIVGEPYARLFGQNPLTNWPADIEVRVLGRVDDAELHALYTAASALCFPSLAEGFGRPPLEAIACGTPAVAADYGAAAEVLGGAVSIVPLDPDAWVDELLPYTKGPGSTPLASPGMGAHSWDAAAETIHAACQNAAAARGRSAR